jgi:hypothetical protein
VLGVGSDSMRWAFTIGIEAALALRDKAGLHRLAALLDAGPVGHVPSLLRAERTRMSAGLLALKLESGTGQACADAVRHHRTFGSPYHLGLALLQHAECALTLAPVGAVRERVDASSNGLAAAEEARQIAERLGALPLLERAASLLASNHAVT